MSAFVGGGVVSGRMALLDDEEAGEIGDGNPSLCPSCGMGDGGGRGLFDEGRRCDGLGVRWPEPRLVRTGRLSVP